MVNGKGNIFMKEVSKNKVEVRNSVLTMDLADTALMPLIKEEAHAGYINGHQDTDYLGTLDVYKIPGYENGNYRLFEIVGDSMIPTIHPREIVVSEHADSLEEIENGSLCIVITEDGIVAKRAYFYEEDRSMLILKSDNSTYKTYSIPMTEILEVWYIRARITNIFNQSQGGDSQKIESLESDMAELKTQMKNFTKGAETNGKARGN
jgi:phage repressor protein C with HTH and peptisase S24 domain